MTIRTATEIDEVLARVDDTTCHGELRTLARMIMCGGTPIMVGPSGCGKTQMVSQVAALLGLPFYYARAVRDECALIGYQDANGRLVRTAFREAFEHGGVFLMDEMDAGDPRALLAFNEAFANGRCDFPDGILRAHADFHVVAAANTHGTGQDRQYVGRNQLDGTTLDRFQVLEVDYDHGLEETLGAPETWTRRVWDAREAVRGLGIRHIVSTRAIVDGARQLAGGFDQAFVEKSVLWRGLPPAQVARVVARMPDRTPRPEPRVVEAFLPEREDLTETEAQDTDAAFERLAKKVRDALETERSRRDGAHAIGQDVGHDGTSYIPSTSTDVMTEDTDFGAMLIQDPSTPDVGPKPYVFGTQIEETRKNTIPPSTRLGTKWDRPVSRVSVNSAKTLIGSGKKKR